MTSTSVDPLTEQTLATSPAAANQGHDMSLVRLNLADAEVLERPGKRSTQIVFRRNAPAARATITHVVMQPSATSPRHRHPGAEQMWIVEQGRGRLLTASDTGELLETGDVVITPPGETHGVEALGEETFIYLTVTTPPEDMAGFYDAPADHLVRE